MKKKKRLMRSMMAILVTVLPLSLLLGLTVGCGHNKSYDNAAYDPVRPSESFEEKKFEKLDMEEAVYDEGAYAEESEATVAGEGREQSATYINSAAVRNEKLIIRNNLMIETKEFNTYIDKLESLVIENSAYIQEQNIFNGSLSGNEVRNAYYLIRVPKAKVPNFSSALQDLEGKMTRKDVSVENVTQRYLDVQRRVNVNKAKEDRLTELLKKAENIKDLISIEKEIATLITEREDMQSELIDLDHSVNYDYYTLNINEVREYKEVKQEKSFGADIAYAFDSSIKGFINAIQIIILFFVFTWIFWVAMIILAIVVVVIIKKRKKKKQSLKEN